MNTTEQLLETLDALEKAIAQVRAELMPSERGIVTPNRHVTLELVVDGEYSHRQTGRVFKDGVFFCAIPVNEYGWASKQDVKEAVVRAGYTPIPFPKIADELGMRIHNALVRSGLLTLEDLRERIDSEHFLHLGESRIRALRDWMNETN